VTVFAANRDLSESVSFETELRGFGPMKVLEHSVLANDDIHAFNTKEDPDRVKPCAGSAAADGNLLTAILPKCSFNMIRLVKI
jgi:alpha-N-arabinofuranosidase